MASASLAACSGQVEAPTISPHVVTGQQRVEDARERAFSRPPRSCSLCGLKLGVAGTSPATTLVYDLKRTKSALIYVKYVGGRDRSAVVAAVRRRGLSRLKSARHGRAAPQPMLAQFLRQHLDAGGTFGRTQ